MSKRKNTGILTIAIALGLFIFTLLLVFIPEIKFLNKFSHNTSYIMLGLVALGLVFLPLRNRKLMFASFTCAAILCLFLKGASNSNIVFPEVNNLPSLSIAHINLGNVSDTYESLISTVKNMETDIISFQEFTPDWNFHIGSKLDSIFKYSEKNVRIDPFGMAVFSKTPIEQKEIFYHEEIPNFKGDVKLGDQIVNLVFSYVLPLLGTQDVANTSEHLSVVADELNRSQSHKLSIGDFNMVYHAKEIMKFRSRTSLHNSRREVPMGTLKMPYDHIFYSSDLECTRFIEINDSNNVHIGILGSYQISRERDLPQKTGSSLGQLNF